MFEERNQERESLIYHLRVFDPDTNKVVGYIDNLSTEGARLLSDEPIPSDSFNQYRLELPRAFEGKRSVELNTVTAWSVEDAPSANFYDSGIRFLDIPAIEKERLMQLISGYRL